MPLPAPFDAPSPLARYARDFALPTAGTLFGAHAAYAVFASTGRALVAGAAFVGWTAFGFGLLLVARFLGLRSDAELAASPELERRVRARRPLMLVALALLIVAAIATALLE